ncbi:2-phosphosulfolactate phosphatase [Actinokineospora iranica]|uniref:Probable 2-phosphosulfolactate phosphatase n=1 Tax=Actinokineospora iranica TaxID=1271860 RepID=A0A1G6QGQ7_9PSEU|nr:2-phosphosulfolactate phosphatase [Actinokineospora iranica]SDC91331.1 2-phosphosulfolactate phosphatase [Actinokineospora iranica]
MITDDFRQTPYGVRFDWGLTGAAALAETSACLVIVDVLSFTTAVSVAVHRGTRVFPYRWRDETAAGFAEDKDAALAVGRRAATAAAPWSLSPAALRAAPRVGRLVLPSPNGSAIAAAARGVPVVAACLRNAGAVAGWLAGRGWGTAAAPVAVIAAGERWPDGTPRPAVEDLLGAGAVIAALGDGGPLSPEAAAARAAAAVVVDVAAAVRDCASGRELRAAGFADDVVIATEVDACAHVPVLVDGAFTAAPGAGGGCADAR